jgi:uncharacterized protein YciI
MSEPTIKPHFLLLYDYVENAVERRAPHRAAHLDLIGRLKREGTVVMGGALGSPPTGAAIVFRTDDRSTVEAFTREDPYVLGGVVTDWRILPWNVVT